MSRGGEVVITYIKLPFDPTIGTQYYGPIIEMDPTRGTESFFPQMKSECAEVIEFEPFFAHLVEDDGTNIVLYRIYHALRNEDGESYGVGGWWYEFPNPRTLYEWFEWLGIVRWEER